VNYEQNTKLLVKLGLYLVPVCYTKAQSYKPRATPGRAPFRQDMAEYPLAWTNIPFMDIYPHLGFRD